MADKKISELPASSALDTDDLLAVVEDGTTVKATVQQLLDLAPSGLPDGYSVPDFIQASGSDQTATMTAAISALPDDSGVVLIPSGTFYSQILIGEHAGLTIRGAGALASTIVAPTTDPMVSQFGTTRGNCTFEDLTFDLDNAAHSAMVVYPEDPGTTFRRCRFINIADNWYGVGCIGSVGTTFEDCEFDDGGLTVARAVHCGNAVRGLRWIRSKARFMAEGIVLDDTPHDHIDVDGGLFDGGWYLLRTRSGGYTNSGGTVTYSSTVLTDSAASFGDVDDPNGINVRALPVLESGSTGTNYFANYVEDAAATFETALVKPGYIVRTATKWAVVASVVSETTLYVEEWFDSTTYRPTDKPADDDAYTVYRVLIGFINANTGTTITVDRWVDFHDGASVTPAAGTLYEVLIDHGGYSGIHASATTYDATGGIRNIRVHGGCRITRAWNDQLSIYGRDARLTVEASVLIDHGQDFGITSHGDHARIFCTAVHNGAVNIFSTGADCRIDAFASGAPYVNAINTLWLGDVVISGSRTRASGTVVVASGALARYGIVLFGQAVDGATDAVDLTGTTADGYSVAEYRLYGDAAAGVTNTVMLDVSGVLSSTNATGTVGPAHPADTPTISTGAIGETIDRRASYASQTIVGGTLYMSSIWLPAGVTVTSISFCNGNTALASGTHQWFGLFDSSRVALRFTTDDTSAAWGTFTVKTLNLSSTFVTTYTGLHYIGLVVTVSGTLPKPYGLTIGSSTISLLPPAICGTADTGLTSPPALPFTAAAFTMGSGAAHFYAYVS